MENLDSSFNFNDPLELTELFRVVEAQAIPQPDYDEEDAGKPGPIHKIDMKNAKEYSFKHTVGWEEIRGIKQYMYPDDWVRNKGEKYYVALHGQAEDVLVLGSYHSMLQHWRLFRNTYPIFKKDGMD